MNESGNSEFSNSNKATYSLSFWQNFLLTIFGAAGLISMVADGPLPITVVSFTIVIVLLLRLISKSNKK
jgi:hypothetical protein